MAEIKKYEKGAVIFKEGQWGMCFYDIVSGQIGIYANYGKENEKLLTELEAGKYFGEMGFIEALPRSATAVALADSELNEIDGDDMSAYLKEEPEKAIAILKNLSDRLRTLSNEYVDVCRTISEYVEAEQQKLPKKEGLMAKIKKIMELSAMYSDIMAEATRTNPNLFTFDYDQWYMFEYNQWH